MGSIKEFIKNAKLEQEEDMINKIAEAILEMTKAAQPYGRYNAERQRVMTNPLFNSIGKVTSTAGGLKAEDMMNKAPIQQPQMKPMAPIKPTNAAPTQKPGASIGSAMASGLATNAPVPTAPTVPQTPAAPYSIQAGNTLWGLAQQQGINDPSRIQSWVNAVARKNQIADPNQINVGQQLRF